MSLLGTVFLSLDQIPMCACVCLDGGVSTQHQAALRPQQVTPLVIKLHLQPLSLLGGQR